MGENVSAEDLARQVGELRVRVLRRVRTRLAGAYASAFHGPGVEFRGFAPYQPGDDVRHIDWQVTARRLQPYVRRYVEERELRMVIALDASESMRIGSTWTPHQRACLIAAALALSAARNGDRTGALFFGRNVLSTVPARRGERHALSVVRSALDVRSPAELTDLRPVLRSLLRLRGHAVVVLLSDYVVTPSVGDASVRCLLGACSRKHEMRAVRLSSADPAGPGPSDVVLETTDPESGRARRLSGFTTGAPEACSALSSHAETVRRVMRSSGVPFVELQPSDDHLRGVEHVLQAAAEP